MAGLISYQTPNSGLDHLFGLWLSSSMNHSLLRPGVDSPGPASVTTAVNEEACASVPLVQYGRGGGAEFIDLLIEII